MGKISVVVTSFNEEKNIEECLKSINGLADEIIVVDNSSEDKTAEIAKKSGAKIYHQKNDPKKIDEQKNFGFSKATGEWILSLDADERVTAELAEEIKAAIESSKNEINGYWVPRKNIIFGKWIKSDMWWPDYQLKIFRRGKGKFGKNNVHQALTVEGETEKLVNHLVHHNYNTISQYIEKLNNYTDIEAESLRETGYSFNWLDSIRFPVDDFVKTFFLQKGYRDSLHGLVLSFLQAFYMEVVFAKIWESRGFEEIEEESFLKEASKEIDHSREKIIYWFKTAALSSTKNPFHKTFLRLSRKLTSANLKRP